MGLLSKKLEELKERKESKHLVSRANLTLVGVFLLLFLFGIPLEYPLVFLALSWVVPVIFVILKRKQKTSSKLKKVCLAIVLWFVLLMITIGLTDATIDIEEPKGETIFSNTVVLKGYVEPAGLIVRVGGKRVTTDEDGKFTAEISLEEGENKISIVAYNFWYRGTKDLLIKRELTEEEKIKKAQEEEAARAEAERKQKEAEVKRKAEEAQRQVEEDARRQAEEESKRKAEEEAKRRAEETEAKRQAQEAQRQVEEEAKRQAEEEAKRKAESPEEQIKKLVQSKLEGTNNMGWLYVDTIEVEQAFGGKYNVRVKFNADDNLTKGMIKSGIQMEVSEILTALFTERGDIQEATVTALFPVQDKYGRVGRGAVYEAVLGVAEASKVSWGMDSATLAFDILPRVCEVSYPYRIF